MLIIKLIGIFIVIIVALVALLLFLGVEIERYPPKAPPGVPSNAEWTGGREGGVWVDCHKNADSIGGYLCSVYSQDGSCVSEAIPYKLFSIHWDEALAKPIYSEAESVPDSLEYNSFVSGEIQLEDNLVLRRADNSIDPVR
jgi:hypothetical protein